MAKKPKVKSAKGETKPFTATTDFIGKPFGPDGPEIHFRAGVPSTPVPVSYIESLSAKKTGEKTAADHG